MSPNESPEPRRPSTRSRAVVARRATLAIAALGAVMAPSAAADDWPPADLRQYVTSGRYLADVRVAAAPAAEWLAERADRIALDRQACAAAGIPFPGAGSADERAATTRSAGATRRWTGTTVLRPRARAAGARGLRARGVRSVLSTSRSPARWTVSDARWAGSRVALTHASTLRLAAGRRATVVRDVRVTVDGRRVRLRGRVGGRAVTLLTGSTRGARATTDRDAARVRLPATTVRLTAAGARRIERTLRVRGVRRGAVGTLSVTAQGPRSAVPGTSGATGGGSGTTATGATGGGASTPTTPTPTPTPVVPTAPEPPTAASCAAIPARPAIVLDIDETALSNYIGTSGDPAGGSLGYSFVAASGQATALEPVHEIYRLARERGIAVFFVTARPGLIAPVTESNLRRVGYDAWDGLTFKNDLTSDKDVHKTAERKKIEDAGYRIVLNVGDQQTDLDGGYAERAFKLPNPFY